MQIQVSCPQCGGKIDFDEKSFVIKCDYCGSRLHLAGKNQICHYRLQSRLSCHEALIQFPGMFQHEFGHGTRIIKLKLLYAPYWRITGMVFRWYFGKRILKSKSASGFGIQKEDGKELRTKRLDLSFPAYKSVSLGMQSFGVRAEVLPLLLFGNISSEEGGETLEIEVQFPEAQKYLRAFLDVGLGTEDFEIYFDDTQLVGETYSLVYFPFWLVHAQVGSKSCLLVVDAVANKITKNLESSEIRSLQKMILNKDDNMEIHALQFIPFKCPVCGWDFPFFPYNSVHVCQACSRGWFEYGGKLHRVQYRVAMASENLEGKKIYYLPFWKMKGAIEASDRTIDTMFAFTGRGYQPFRKSCAPPDKNEPLKLAIPAFRIKNIKIFNRVGAHLSINPVECQYHTNSDFRSFHFGGVVLTFTEAQEMARVVLFSLIPPFRRKLVHSMKSAKITLTNPNLVYMAFYEDGLYLREGSTGYAIQKGTVYVPENK